MLVDKREGLRQLAAPQCCSDQEGRSGMHRAHQDVEPWRGIHDGAKG